MVATSKNRRKELVRQCRGGVLQRGNSVSCPWQAAQSWSEAVAVNSSSVLAEGQKCQNHSGVLAHVLVFNPFFLLYIIGWFTLSSLYDLVSPGKRVSMWGCLGQAGL